MRLSLDEHRNLGELVELTFTLLGRHLAVFLSLTLLVVAPFVLVVDGVWGGALADGGDAMPSTGAAATSFAFSILVIPPLVTALHVVVVQGIARGDEPTVVGALSSAAARLLPAVAAVALFSVVVAVGFVLLIVPGIYCAVRYYLAAQAAVVDRLGPTAALRRSAQLVDGQWWRVLGLLAAFSLLLALVNVPASALIRGIDDGVVFSVCTILLQTVGLSLGAIFGTLLFFDLRARGKFPWQGTPLAQADAPERPIQPPRI